MTEAAMDAIPEAVREALETTSRRYGLYCRRSREAAEDALEIGRALLWIKEQIRHGLWMLALKAMKISYDAASRHMRLVRRGATVEMIQEHGVTGALILLSQPRAPVPEMVAGDAGTEGDELCTAAKFEPPPTAPGPAEASVLLDEFEEPVPEDEDAAEPALPLPEGEDAAGDAEAIQTAWQTVRERLHGELGDGVFKSWVKPCRIEKRGAGAAVIAPTGFMCNRVRQNYGDRIRDLWKQALPDMELDFRVGTGAPKTQRDLPLPTGRATASAGNVTLAVSPKTAQGNAPGLRLAAAAAAAADARLLASTKLMMMSFAWRYWPGRPWRGDIEQLGALTGLQRSTSYDALNQAVEYGYLHSDSARGGRRAFWWPVVEIAAQTDWKPPEQFELNFHQTRDRTAADYIGRFSGIAAYG